MLKSLTTLLTSAILNVSVLLPGYIAVMVDDTVWQFPTYFARIDRTGRNVINGIYLYDRDMRKLNATPIKFIPISAIKYIDTDDPVNCPLL